MQIDKYRLLKIVHANIDQDEWSATYDMIWSPGKDWLILGVITFATVGSLWERQCEGIALEGERYKEIQRQVELQIQNVEADRLGRCIVYVSVYLWLYLYLCNRIYVFVISASPIADGWENVFYPWHEILDTGQASSTLCLSLIKWEYYF